MEKVKNKKAKSGPATKIENQVIGFVENYLTDFNATRAYLESVNGSLEYKSAMSIASTYLRSAKVQEYLRKRLEERRQELHIDQSYVVRKLIDITECDYVDSIQYVTREQLDKIPPDIRKFIQSIKIAKSKNYSDSFENESEKYEVTFMSKDKALELLGKHTGAFMKDNVQGQYDMGKMSFTDALKELDI